MSGVWKSQTGHLYPALRDERGMEEWLQAPVPRFEG